MSVEFATFNDEGLILKNVELEATDIKSRTVTDGFSNLQIFISTLLSDAGDIPIGDVRLSETPECVFFIIPGNPGVSGAYLPWLYHLSYMLGPKSLVVFSGHLGHLQTATVDTEFTCEQNIKHQTQQVELVLSTFKTSPIAPKFFFGGHSAGAYFILHALETALATRAEYALMDITMFIYCGTLIQFGSLGKFKAMVAASKTGVNLINRIRRSNWMEKKAGDNDYYKQLLTEFSDSFVVQMSNLTRDELQHLPEEAQQQIGVIDKMKVPTYFLMAANDPYVPKSIQKQYLNHFGPEKVFIAQDWRHAYCLHLTSFHEAAEITASVIREGRIPNAFQKRMEEEAKMTRLNSMTFDIRSFLAAIAVGLWSLPSTLMRTPRCKRAQ